MKHQFILFLLIICLQVRGQDVDSEVSKLTPVIQALKDFTEKIPNEKVYLHFDNTSYYQGDNIWFKCYVVTSGLNQLSVLSKTLYVELLNPGGEIIDKRILKIENGQCHGDFSLNRIPFYSGFYEVRAYTKYMLNFGEDIIFSRLLPVFDRPKNEGNYEEKNMLKYGRYGPIGNFPMKRKTPEKGKDVNLRFFPEGGNLIQSVESRVAFEATDEMGNPIELTGVVFDSEKREISKLTTLHEGKGVFTYTPGVSNRKATVEIEYSGKKYRFDLPSGLPQGVVMEVDNLSLPDSIGITLRRNAQTQAELFGVAVLNGGELHNAYYAYSENEEIDFRIDKTKLPLGVSQIVLFDSKGTVICDRLIFTGIGNFLKINTKTDKTIYKPHELINMDISIKDKEENPVNTTFSLSVRDGENEVEYKHNIQTELLLMSEIKGYVRNPSYYFDVETQHAASLLDLLLMVQGWRRYSWEQMAGIKPFELKYFIEQGIETNGQIVSFVRSIPKPNVDVGLLLKKKNEGEELNDSFFETYKTDSAGRFSFVSDLQGRWNMILTVSEKGKKKDHRIILDRVFSPDPKRYNHADMQISLADNKIKFEEETDGEFNEDLKSFLIAYQDSLSSTGFTEKIHSLPEVTIKAKKNTREQDIRRNRSTSTAYYDMSSELDDIYDRGKFVGDDIHQMLINSNNEFYHRPRETEFLFYKGKFVLFVVNYIPVNFRSFTEDIFKYKSVNLNAIKSIYINETDAAKCRYSEGLPCLLASDAIGCVVFIETYSDDWGAADAKGVRKTWLEGYSSIKEFYSPDYSMPPLDIDYRRTLYWNPMVTTDENGIAKIRFYNNSSCKNFSINAETITSEGITGVYTKE